MTGHPSFGATLRAWDVGDLSVAAVSMPRGLELSPHAHVDGQVCLVLEGAYTETVDGAAHPLRPGSIVVRPPRALHANRFDADEDALVMVVSVPEDAIGDHGWDGLGSRSGPAYVHADAIEPAWGALRRHAHARGEGAHLAALGLSLLVAGRAACTIPAPAMSEPPWLAAAEAHIRRGFRDRLSLATVAQSIGVPPARLAAAFRRHRGASVGDVIARTRLREAMRLLATERMPIDRIAVAAGFYDQAHLGRAFRRHLRDTPAAYRRRQRA